MEDQGLENASAPSVAKKGPGKLVLLGGIGCGGMLLMCCLLAALGHWLESRQRRDACGAPAIARAFAERALAKAAEDDQNRSTTQNRTEREHDEISAATYRELAARVQARAETLTDQELTEFLYSEIARADQIVCDKLKATLAALPADQTEAREWLTWRIESRPSPREEIATWVEVKRRELEQKYKQGRRSRMGPDGPSGRIDSGPQGSDAAASFGVVEARVRLARFSNGKEALRISNPGASDFRIRRIVLNGTYSTERTLLVPAGRSSDMTWSLENFRDAQGRSFGI